MQTPTIPKGTRDFSPADMAKRNYIFDTIGSVFRLYGFRQIETPAMENLSTLMGKYGEEGDKLLFKILNSGDFLAGIDAGTLSAASLTASRICEKGLRYDLTVPFARYVVQHRNEITFPFRRFQIQPVWRADRPQKGRYREFFQCDADIIGTDSLLCEVELLQIIDEVFSRFGVRVAIKLNNRKILAGIAQIIGEAERITDITVAIDKLDKTGLDAVNAELAAKGLSTDAIARLQPIIELRGTNEEKLSVLKNIFSRQATGQSGNDGITGITEIETVLNKIALAPLRNELQIDLTLARGLNYYTGAIVEVKALDVEIGSITGGGRYDNLTGVFGLTGVSGVGISFGADRIFDVLNQLNLYPDNATRQTTVLFVNFGSREETFVMPILARLRSAGIPAEIYPDAAKLKKQFAYADDNHIPFVAIAGENEIAEHKITVKNMNTGEQVAINDTDAVKFLETYKN
jgi:histidyl-tRNA synthetase